MKVDVLNLEGKKRSVSRTSGAIFEAPINVDLMHQAYVRQLANARLGTHETKVRSEVSGGGAKPWKQKGTGRARRGSAVLPNGWVVDVFTPHTRAAMRCACRKKCVRRPSARLSLQGS